MSNKHSKEKARVDQKDLDDLVEKNLSMQNETIRFTPGVTSIDGIVESNSVVESNCSTDNSDIAQEKSSEDKTLALDHAPEAFAELNRVSREVFYAFLPVLRAQYGDRTGQVLETHRIYPTSLDHSTFDFDPQRAFKLLVSEWPAVVPGNWGLHMAHELKAWRNHLGHLSSNGHLRRRDVLRLVDTGELVLELLEDAQSHGDVCQGVV